jgi:hypothetical protein
MKTKRIVPTFFRDEIVTDKIPATPKDTGLIFVLILFILGCAVVGYATVYEHKYTAELKAKAEMYN